MGPIVQYVVVTQDNQVQSNAQYIVRIPHILSNVQRCRKYIKVRHGDINQGQQMHLVASTGNDENMTHGTSTYSCPRDTADDLFDIDDTHVIVITTKPKSIIVTVEGMNCCSRGSNMFLFGSLDHTTNGELSASIKVMFASLHSKIKDYQLVSYLPVCSLVL